MATWDAKQSSAQTYPSICVAILLAIWMMPDALMVMIALLLSLTMVSSPTCNRHATTGLAVMSQGTQHKRNCIHSQ